MYNLEHLCKLTTHRKCFIFKTQSFCIAMEHGFRKLSSLITGFFPWLSLFVHPQGSYFPLNNHQTLQINANPEFTPSLSILHSLKHLSGGMTEIGCWPICLWPHPWRQCQLLRPTASWLGHLGVHFAPVALPEGSGVGREAATVFIRQSPATTDHTKITCNLSKNSQLITSIQHQNTLPRGPFLLPVGLPIGSSFDGNSRAPTPSPPHIHSLFIVWLLHVSLSLPFHSLDYLLNYHALSLQQTFPNLTLYLVFLPIQSILLPDLSCCNIIFCKSPSRPSTYRSPRLVIKPGFLNAVQLLHNQPYLFWIFCAVTGPLMVNQHIYLISSTTHKYPGPCHPSSHLSKPPLFH